MMIATKQPEKVGFSTERLQRISDVMHGYIDRGDTGGILTLVERQGETVHMAKCGYQDVAARKALEFDHIFRIYSMTKPIVSMALMMLFEQAKFHLSEPIYKYLPEFKGIKVWEAGGKLVPPKTVPTIKHLLTHTAGLTYGFFGETDVDKLYQSANLFDNSQTLEEMVKKVADFPLICHPGERWVYSVSIDVAGRLVEVLSGISLADFLQEKIFDPLGMVDTSFSIPEEKIGRLTSCYAQTEQEKLFLDDPGENSAYRNVRLYSGGGGLLSTLEDYRRFARLVLNWGELDGVRLVGRKTLELMGSNHIPANLLPLAVTDPFPGFGFGIGFSVLMDISQTQALGSVGTLGWSGMASTDFWVDPQEDLIAIIMTQLIPLDEFNLHADFRNLVYQALIA